MKTADWALARGRLCPKCHREVYQLVKAGGASDPASCLRCARKVEEQSDQVIEMKALLATLRQQRSRASQKTPKTNREAYNLPVVSADDAAGQRDPDFED